MRVVIDAEFSGFASNAICWCIVCRDIDTDDVYVFEHPELYPEDFNAFATRVTLWIGHNLIGFDVPHLASVGLGIRGPVFDTLVVSRLLNYNILGGHSLEAWADRLPRVRTKLENFLLDNSRNPWYNLSLRLNLKSPYGTPKEGHLEFNQDVKYFTPILKEVPTEFRKVEIKDFSIYSFDLVYRCVADTAINAALYRHFLRWTELPAFKSALETEHRMAELCLELQDTGFALDVPAVRTLYVELSDRLSQLDQELTNAFPPRDVLKDTIRPRRTASGAFHATDVRRLHQAGVFDIVADVDYKIYASEPFNPGSHKQIIERLNEAGWVPTEKTKGHAEATKRQRGKPKALPEKLAHFKDYGWTLSEANLATLPADAPQAAQRLVERLLLRSRVSVLEAWLELETHGRIHGRFFHIGSWTQRMSHQNPNMANVPKVVHPDKPTPIQILSDGIAEKMRSAWVAPPGRRLVGVDADGIQMRIFAHYVNDKRLIQALLTGNKDDKTDIHSLHKHALGDVCKSRDAAKRFIYAWLLGAGAGKVAEILECSFSEAKEAVDHFIEFYPGLKGLRNQLLSDAKRGYFIGLDGRFVVCDDAHLMLAGYLQNGEAIIMKRGCIWWHNFLHREHTDFKFVNFVHDEWQTEVPDNDEIARRVVEIQTEAIRRQGDELHLNCPLAGSGVWGRNWLETH